MWNQLVSDVSTACGSMRTGTSRGWQAPQVSRSIGEHLRPSRYRSLGSLADLELGTLVRLQITWCAVLYAFVGATSGANTGLANVFPKNLFFRTRDQFGMSGCQTRLSCAQRYLPVRSALPRGIQVAKWLSVI